MAGPWEQYQQTKKPWEQFAPANDFAGRMKTDLGERAVKQKTALDAHANDEQSLASTGLQLAGQGAGLITDLAANAVGSLARTAYDIALPEAGQDANAAMINDASQYLAGTKAGRAAESTAGAIGKGVNYLNENFPVTMRNVGAVANIASAVPVLKTAINVGEKTIRGTAGAAKEAFEARRLAAVQDAVLPKQTPKEIAETALQRSSGGGLMNKQVYTPNQYEAEMIKTAREAGIKPSAPLVDNIQILNNVKNEEAKRLRFVLEKANVPIDQNTLNQAGLSITQKIAANPLIDENGATVRKILEAAQTAIDKNKKTAAGILQARKDFDAAIGRFQPSAFDTDAAATAFRSATKEVRQGMNDIVKSAVPDANVAASLTKQSHLYEAIDNMAGKLSQEPTNRFGRFFQSPAGKTVKYGAVAAGLTGAGNTALNAVKGDK